MKKALKFVCWICGSEYDSEADAKKCEAKGLMVPWFKIGDTVTYLVNLGSDRDGPYHEKRTGKVIDILFPVPLLDVHVIEHHYQVSYIIKRNESGKSSQFFDEKNIEPLQTVKTVEIVNEFNMFKKDVLISDNSLERTIVTNWDDYVSKIIQRNPQLKSRLASFTAMLRKSGCLD